MSNKNLFLFAAANLAEENEKADEGERGQKKENRQKVADRQTLVGCLFV
jgi:hypothetical protein